MSILPQPLLNNISTHRVTLIVLAMHLFILLGIKISFPQNFTLSSPQVTFIGDILAPVDFMKVKNPQAILPNNMLLKEGTRQYTGEYFQIEKPKIVVLNQKNSKTYSKPINYPAELTPLQKHTGIQSSPIMKPVIYKRLQLETP